MRKIIMENLIRKVLLEESDKIKSDFEIFSKKRYDGAKKIAETAKSKGGPAMLTYHHFIVKLPYYRKAFNGKFKIDEAKKELSELMQEVCSIGKNVNITQVDFQKLVGKIEVLGELIIKHK